MSNARIHTSGFPVSIRRPLPIALALVLALCSVIALPVGAQAASYPAGTVILGSACTAPQKGVAGWEDKWTPWWGGIADQDIYESIYGSQYAAHGRLRMCWAKYRLPSDGAGDYYGISMTVEWEQEGYNRESTSAPMALAASSSHGSILNDFAATETFTSQTSCTTPIPLNVSIGPFKVGTEIKLCNDYTVTLSDITDASALWTSNRAGAIHKMETTFVQQVEKGVVPVFDIQFAYPKYVWQQTRFAPNYPEMWKATKHQEWINVFNAGAGSGGGSGGGFEDVCYDCGPGGGSSGTSAAKAEPAMAYDLGNTMKIYRWSSTGTSFRRLSDYQSGSFHLSHVGDLTASGDVDGDGDDDIVMAYQNGDGTFSFHVFKNGISWAGTWYTSGAFSLGPVGGRLVVGDFNGDGKAEPALARDNGTTMTIYRWQSTGSSFTHITDYQSGTFDLGNVGNRVATGDADGDGDDDIVMAYQNGDGTFSFHVFRNGSSWAGTWYTSGSFSLGPVGDRLVVDDFTGNGTAEPALVRDNGNGTMKIWRWTSNGSSFSRTTDYESGSFALSNVNARVASGNVTGDGRADIVMAYQNSDGTCSLHVFDDGLSWAGRWYTGGQYNLDNVDGRLVVGRW